MASHLVDVPIEDYRFGMRLKVDFEDRAGADVTLVMFRSA